MKRACIRRGLGLLLLLALMMTLLPAPALAEGTRVRLRIEAEPADLDFRLRPADSEEELLPEEDGSYLLEPGDYLYSARRQGFLPIVDAELHLPADAEERSLSVGLEAQVMAQMLLPGQGLADLPEYAAAKPLPTLTGDQALDTVNIARSQLGYSGAGGTVYGAWWNTVTNWGVDYTYAAWCAMFACWCAYQAGAGLNVAYDKNGASAKLLFQWLKDHATADTQCSGTPRPGDFVFFDDGTEGTVAHVAIVAGYDSSTRTLSFIGGNQSNSVTQSSVRWQKYSYWGSERVIGTGRPNYSNTPLSYADRCERYPTWLRLRLRDSASLMSQPCRSATDASSTVLEQLGSEALFEAEAIYVNSVGECWYAGRSLSSGRAGYLYSAPCEIDLWLENELRVTGSVPAELIHIRGNSYGVRWRLESEHLWLDEVEGDICFADSGLSALGGEAAAHAVQSLLYQLGGEAVDRGMVFGSLASGDYRVLLRVTPVYYYDSGDGRTLSALSPETLTLVDFPCFVSANAALPRGELERCSGRNGCLAVSGWALDPDLPQRSLSLRICIGGEEHSLIAALPRQDVNRLTGLGGDHGFEALIETGLRGTQTVELYAENPEDGAWTLLGGAEVSIGDSNAAYIEAERRSLRLELDGEADASLRCTVGGALPEGLWSCRALCVDPAVADAEWDAETLLIHGKQVGETRIRLLLERSDTGALLAEETLQLQVTEGVPIDEASFPDEAFRAYVAESFDSNGDGCLSRAERNAVRVIRCGERSIRSLQGIELFTLLRELNCRNNLLSALDLRLNSSLETVLCYGNSISRLQLGENRRLGQLRCYDNALTRLDLGGCPLLAAAARGESRTFSAYGDTVLFYGPYQDEEGLSLYRLVVDRSVELLTSPPRRAGDANGDGAVNGLDAIRIARYLAGIETELELSNADVTGDGRVDGRDLIRLIRHLAGQSVELR